MNSLCKFTHMKINKHAVDVTIAGLHVSLRQVFKAFILHTFTRTVATIATEFHCSVAADISPKWDILSNQERTSGGAPLQLVGRKAH
ncbi:hypothetical protein MTO96_023123 [Rhipicephalus appendiculatus]